MRVLIADFDLYQSMGGGQSVYRQLIDRNPQVEFYYLGKAEGASAARPANAVRIPWKETYDGMSLTGEFSTLDIPMWSYSDFYLAANIAASVSQIQLDVVDVPDYRAFGYLLGPALRCHGQSAVRVALALHGNLSETQPLNWGGPAAGADVSSDVREQWQYRVADVRYGLSRDYLEHWAQLGGCAGQYLDPLRFVPPPSPLAWKRKDQGVTLNFIGRTEGFKGPDLFIELLSWLQPGSYRAGRIIGPAVDEPTGLGSTEYLRRMASRRSVAVDFSPPMSRAELKEVFAGRSITVLPSRMDTFNLVALESLFLGCPTAISTRAGVCRFLKDTAASIPYVPIDVDRLHAAGPLIADVIRRYPEHREQLIHAVRRHDPTPTGLTLEDIYDSGAAGDSFLRRQAERLYANLEAFYRRHRTATYCHLAMAGVRLCDAVEDRNEHDDGHAPIEESALWSKYRRLFYTLEKAPESINRKVETLSRMVAECRVDRVRVWAELARLERIRGNDLVAATYETRVMRSCGEDRLGTLPLTAATLRGLGFGAEVKALFALYGDPSARLHLGREILAGALERHRSVAERTFELVEDRRFSRQPKVTIIVSLYSAVAKMETFLRMLAQLEWVRDGRAELVFVDSHSPTDERGVYQALAEELGIGALYARTAERETIQTAWNRGILLSRGEYLMFLGVDEMVRPSCCETLASELDDHPELDWVQGNALITEVDDRGTQVRDVMLYQRIPYEQDFVYLETCYLSWVGGMYRKSIHQRFGYYDESFGAAGDTEFKNRVLPFIKSKTLPVTLGIFLNYADERTTQSPKAEIEDLRAWYLHRSVAGVEYAMRGRGDAEVLALFGRALKYRKSYFGTTSTDLDYAAAIAEYGRLQRPDVIPEKLVSPVIRALEAVRELDWLPGLSPHAAVLRRRRTEAVFRECAQEVQAAVGEPLALDWRVFNDNRFEQHSWAWPGKPLRVRQEAEHRGRWCGVTSSVAPNMSADAQYVGSAGIHPGVQKADSEWVGRVESLVAALRAGGEAAVRSGRTDLARELGMVTECLRGLANGRPSAPGVVAASIVVRLLTEAAVGRLQLGAVSLDDRALEVCDAVIEIARPHCPELADGLEAIASQVRKQQAQARSMEITARLLTCASPAEAVRRHAADLGPSVLETLRRASSAAKANGNQPYSERLSRFAQAVAQELGLNGSENQGARAVEWWARGVLHSESRH